MIQPKLNRYIIVLFSVVMIAAGCSKQRISQREQKSWEKRQWEIEHEDKNNYHCEHRNIYSRKQRLKFAPFNRTKDIRLISFVTSSDTIFSEYLPVENHALDTSRVKEMLALNEAQIDSLTDILYNVKYSGKISVIEGTGCYDPHNAILFIGHSGEVLEYIEICFACQASRMSDEHITIGDDCVGKYALLKDFFIRTGIKIGTLQLR